MFSSETYTIEDCLKYNSNTYSANDTFNYTLPSTFKIEIDFLISTVSNNSAYLRVGESTSRTLLVGKVGSTDSVWKTTVRTSSTGSGDVPYTGNSISTSSSFQTKTITFDGTTFSFEGTSVTNFNGVSLDKLVDFGTWKSGTTSGQIKNIKIKPL